LRVHSGENAQGTRKFQQASKVLLNFIGTFTHTHTLALDDGAGG
jgi:hypothetical protein